MLVDYSAITLVCPHSLRISSITFIVWHDVSEPCFSEHLRPARYFSFPTKKNYPENDISVRQQPGINQASTRHQPASTIFGSHDFMQVRNILRSIDSPIN